MKAIVLSGGAAWGAYEVGVLKALSEQQGFDPQIVTGTSVGAFNAAILSIETIQRLEEIWLQEIPEKGISGNGVLRVRGNPLPFLIPPNPVKFLTGMLTDGAHLATAGVQRTEAFIASQGGVAAHFSELVDVSAFVSCEPLRQTITKTVDFARIRASKKILRIVATDWECGKPQKFCNEDMVDEFGATIILASTAIPGVFPPVRVANKIYVDGGVVMNTPLKPALEAGAGDISVISLDPALGEIDISELDNSIEAFLRVAQVAIGTAVSEDIATAGWINAGIEVMQRARDGEDIQPIQLRDFMRVAEQLQKKAAAGSEYKEVTIHHYQPATSIGSPLGLLDFTLSNITTLIARGYQDTITHLHDATGSVCRLNGCVIPTAATRVKPAAMSAAS